METLVGKGIKLRALEAEDLDFLYFLENDETIWELSNTQTPYSRFVLKKYLDNSHLDIYETKQLRLVIGGKEDQNIGFVDLYNFDPVHRRVGVGIVILKSEQKKGYGKEAVELVINYVFSYLNVHQIFASVAQNNDASIQLFESLKFEKTGVRKDWILSKNEYVDEFFYQKINVH